MAKRDRLADGDHAMLPDLNRSKYASGFTRKIELTVIGEKQVSRLASLIFNLQMSVRY